MNKIFKVIWNNAKRCYVVASELAISHSKSNSSRTIRKSIAALGIALAVYAATGSALAENTGGHIEGINYIGDSPYNVTIDSNVTGSVYGRKEDSNTSEKATVTISSETVDLNVYGGYSNSGNAASNSVTITGGTVELNVYVGFSNSGNAVSNSVTITGGTVDLNVYVGYSYSGNAASNSVIISGGTVKGDVYSGNSYSGNAASNSVRISGGTMSNVYGGTSHLGYAASNSVNISSGTVNKNVYGGYSNSGYAASNSVRISGGTMSNVCGGVSYSGNAASNSVNISSGIVKCDIYGGYVSSGSGNAASNSVNITGGTVNQHVFGGRSYSGNAASNSVNISGDTTSILGNIYGGVASGTGNAYENKVNIATGTLKIVYAGYSESGSVASNSVNISGDTTKINEIYGGYVNSGTGSASYNILNISSGTINLAYGCYTNGTGDANENQVTMTGGEIVIDGSINNSGNLYGGYVESGSGNAISNSVNISGDTTSIGGYVYGGYVESGNGNAASNSVNISGDTTSIGGYVYGGYVESGNGNAASNLVNISGGTIGSIDEFGYIIGGEVYGGYVEQGGGIAASNSVNISGGTIYDNVYGGNSYKGDAASNSVTINDGTVNGWVVGGKLGTDNENSVIFNKVTINNGTITKSVCGGDTKKGSASNNFVYLIDGTVNGAITGGYAGSKDSESNIVNISGGTVEDNVTGGMSLECNAASNSVYISGGKIDKNVGGGTSGFSNATGNIVDISGGTVGGDVIGGSTEAGIVASNSVTICGDSTHISGNIYGGSTYLDNQSDVAFFNKVNIISGTVDGDVYGGYVLNGRGFTNENHVNIIGGTINKNVYGGWGYNGEANNNFVNISGDTTNILGNLYGGLASYTGSVSHNQVTVNGGTFGSSSKIFGGYVNNPNNTSSSASSNKVNLSGTVTGLNEVGIYGYYFENKSGTHSGNELHIGRTIYYDDEGNIKRDSEGKIIYKSDSSSVWQGKSSDDTVNNSINKIANFETIALHSVAWDNDLPAIKAAAIENIGTVDITDLKFYENGSEKTTFEFGDKMNLLTWENEKESLINLKYRLDGIGDEQTVAFSDNPSGITVKTVSVSEKDKGIVFEGTGTGNINKVDKALQFSLTSITLNSVGLSDWDGIKTSGVPDEWGLNTDGVNISGVFADPGLSYGESKNILTASTAIFKDEKIDESIRYAEGSFNNALENGVAHSGIQTGGVKATDGGKTLTYYAMEKTIDKFDLADWDGENAVSVPINWMMNDGASIETDGMSNLPGTDEEKQVFILKSDTEGYFANVAINGENIYGKKQNKFTDSDESQSIVLSGTQDKGIILDSAKANLVYKFGSKDVTSLKLNSVLFKDGAELLSRDKYNYSKLTSLDTDAFNINFEKPETITVNQTMTLLKANDTLTDIAAVEKSNAYSYSPVSGVTMDAVIRSSLEAKSGKVALTAFSNKADKLTFGDVEWKDEGSLIDHKTMLNNVSFDGADVDTTKIAFTNKQKLDADMQMTLVSDFGDSVGTITGTKYKVGTAYEGEGSAYLDGSDLVFKTKTGAGLSDETHTAVMAMDAGIAMLAAGNEHVGNAIESLGMAANMGSDGVSTAASVGGASSRYETGSHVDTNSWNIALAVGKNLEKKDGTMEYGLFAEYGRGNYTLHMNGVEDAGSGSTHYTGGGLLMKWTNSHNVYTEASFRLGNMKENTSNILHDGAGNSYGYDKKAKYKGGHIGFGKKYREDENTELEIFGKFFYNQREGFNFAAGADQYSIDDVRSRVLRAGFRLASTDRKWNRYGGIAYDHEFGGESTGSVNGMAIRSASIKGGTIRGEFGIRREATKTNPWKTDISLYGFTGKRNGFGGNIAVEYHF